MKISFSTLACPDWTMPQIIAIAASLGYDGIELRYVQGEDSLWKLPVFRGNALSSTKRTLADCGLTISCLDTSCRFHSMDAQEWQHWIDEGERMSDLAAALEAPGLRIFGDTIQPGTSRASTRRRIAEGISKLSQTASKKGIEVWIESHGDFASAPETLAILAQAAVPRAGVVWDPANCLIEAQESPTEGASKLGSTIRHTHIKDLRKNNGGWDHVLMGDGSFPGQQLLAALRGLRYDRFISFEWEKKWHPEIAEAEIALPHFVNWFRKEMNS
jgi:sugar phosphate isomerase/epimerase